MSSWSAWTTTSCSRSLGTRLKRTSSPPFVGPPVPTTRTAAHGSRTANNIYRVISEAHKALSDPDKRAAYDQELSEGSLRLSDEGRKEGGSDDPAMAAKTEKGAKYWQLALQQWRDGDYQGCVMNIQFALTFEKGNETFEEYLDKAKRKAQEQSSEKKKNPYKLRLV